LQADEGDRQQKQQMVRSQQGVTNATQQSLQSRKVCAVSHPEGVMGMGWTEQGKAD
jgi:hypothetical protein